MQKQLKCEYAYQGKKNQIICLLCKVRNNTFCAFQKWCHKENIPINTDGAVSCVARMEALREGEKLGER